jgi:hypothetical protein
MSLPKFLTKIGQKVWRYPIGLKDFGLFTRILTALGRGCSLKSLLSCLLEIMKKLERAGSPANELGAVNPLIRIERLEKGTIL